MMNIPETASWAAHCRAIESSQKDALFVDPLAQEILRLTGYSPSRSSISLGGEWVVRTRTKLIDDLVAESVALGCDVVVNLAAGFDSRPYRMSLPGRLRWFEMDTRQIFDAKKTLLADASPQCHLTRWAFDLSDEVVLRAFLGAAAEGSNKIFVITEGLLHYLGQGLCGRVLAELERLDGHVLWATTLMSEGSISAVKASKSDLAALVDFVPDVANLEGRGWVARRTLSIFRQAVALRRLPLKHHWRRLLPEPDHRRPGTAQWLGVALLERGALP